VKRLPDHVPNYEPAGADWRRVPAGHDLAARAQLPRTPRFVNVKSLRDIEGEPLLELHEADAVPRGIADGA